MTYNQLITAIAEHKKELQTKKQEIEELNKRLDLLQKVLKLLPAIWNCVVYRQCKKWQATELMNWKKRAVNSLLVEYHKSSPCHLLSLSLS